MSLLWYLVVAVLVLLIASVVLVLGNRFRPLSNPVIRAVLDRLGDQVAVYDGAGVVVRANPAWLEAGGAPLGAGVAQGFDPRDPVDSWLEECRTKRRPLSSLVCRRGSLRTLGLTPLEDEFGDFLGGVMVMSGAETLEERMAAARLTDREADLLVSILQGLTYFEASATLGIGEATVKTHLQAMYRKTGCHSRHELAAWFTPAS